MTRIKQISLGAYGADGDNLLSIIC